MDYRGYLDLNRGELSIGAPWIYVTLFLEQAPPPGTLAFYGVEVDIDVDGRGDYLITGAAPASTDWTTNGVRVLRDTNNDVGAAHPMTSDPPAGGAGYDELIFDQGQGTDPDAAWIRLAPASSSQVQIAFKYSVIGSPDEWTWGVWADEGVNKPEWFDYNDHFTARRCRLSHLGLQPLSHQGPGGGGQLLPMGRGLHPRRRRARDLLHPAHPHAHSAGQRRAAWSSATTTSAAATTPGTAPATA